VSKKWYDKGIRFECQGSGKCCVSHDSYGYVYLTLQDRRNMAKLLNMSTLKFTKSYCQQVDNTFFLKEALLEDGSTDPACRFLKDKKCQVYKARPTQCRTWPFWPDNMNAKTWNKEVKTFCPGIGKGRLHKLSEIEKPLQEEIAAEKEIFNES